MPDLLGYNSLLVVTLLIYIFSSRWPNISKIIWTAFTIRMFVLLLGHYLIDLPDSDGDTIKFVSNASQMAEGGFLNVINNFEGPKARFIEWLLAVSFSILGTSELMAKSFSLSFGVGSVILSWFLAKKIWDIQTANKVGWIMALFPSLILYSALVMREPYLIFFLILAIFGIVLWMKNRSFTNLFIAIIGFMGTIFFHGSMIVGMFIFLSVVFIIYGLNFLKKIRQYKLSISSLIIFLIIFVIFGLFSTQKIHVSYLNSFERALDPKVLQHQSKVATRGEASWPKWTIINTPIEIVYKAPIRSLYFVLAPFAWDIKKTKHFIGFIDACLYLCLSIIILINIKKILQDPTLRIILLILLSYLLIYGIGVGNFGTGIRHRSKLVILFILLAAPYIKNIKFIKKSNSIKYLK